MDIQGDLNVQDDEDAQSAERNDGDSNDETDSQRIEFVTH